MKKGLAALSAAFLISFSGSAAAVEKETSSYLFKYHMHQLFDSFNQASLSASIKKFEITDIYLRNILENINEARNYLPEVNKEGGKIDKDRLNQRLNDLSKRVSDLRTAIIAGDAEGIKHIPQDVQNACASCHKEEAKLTYLFKAPRQPSIFAQYMHKVSDHMDIARAYMEEGGRPEDVEENIKLIGYYIELLEDTFPEAGPSGVIMDKDNFKSRVKEIKGINNDMLKNVKERKPTGIESLRHSLNSLCIACHEPERLK